MFEILKKKTSNKENFIRLGIAILVAISTTVINKISAGKKEAEEKNDLEKPSTKKLENLIGLSEVKKNIDSIINSIEVEKLRGEKVIAGHYVFEGNPGTGKTTVARILGKKFKELGLLQKGHFIEVKREDLVGRYSGHTATKTKKVLEKALGGVLFIDEAYSLNTSERDSFGIEAINTIVPFIEDNRDNMILIISGYEKPIKDFLKTNPGLQSRFDHTINFKDYNEGELYQIFKLLSKEFSWNESTDKKLKNLFWNMVKTKDRNFGNGREVRRAFEVIKRNQNNRLSAIDGLKKDDNRLYVFTERDIVV